MSSIPTKGIVYYTDSRLPPLIQQACQRQLAVCNGLPIVSVSLQPMDFGRKNIVLPLQRGYMAMFQQILAGIEAMEMDIIFLAEHDILYHAEHFLFTPPDKDTYYYNQNNWKVNYNTGHALYYDCKQTLALCCYRDRLLAHYQQRVKNTQQAWERYGGDTHEYRKWIRSLGFEPGSHHRKERVDNYPSATWKTENANIDIKHGGNLTPARWRKDQFRDPRSCQGWQESDRVPGWGVTEGRFAQVLEGIREGNFVIK